ncbi:MAG: DUF3179 domain-containing protein [Chloroflexota bacterium]|nr:DUF3179 domain-containing protein [Chloroflexota bacterium]
MIKRGKTNLMQYVAFGLLATAALAIGQTFMGGLTNGWETDFETTIIELDEVISGGVPRDGIPPIDRPVFDDVKSVRRLSDKSPVISLTIDGDSRAYPLEVMTRHEIVNDVVGGLPVAVTFCPLCNSAIVFDRRVDGKALRFGVSGNLRFSDLVMWDDATESWWQQLTGEAIVGDYAGRKLDMASSQLISFGLFRARYPQGKVLRGPLGLYGNNPYRGYDSSPAPFLFAGKLDERLPAMARVLAAEIDGTAAAYPFDLLRRRPVINDNIAGRDIVALWQGGAVSALDEAVIDVSRDVGMALMFERRLDTGETLTFYSEAGGFMDEETGSRWNFFGEAIDGPLAGAKLRQLHAFPHFWFAWAAFYPDTALYGIEANVTSAQ